MQIVRLGIILMLIAGLAAGGLSLLNGKTAPIIQKEKERQQARARQEVANSIGGIRFEKVDDPDGFEYYNAFDDTGTLVGYVTLARGKGYSSTVETIAGFDTTFHVSGIKITFQQETPGLGTKSVEIRKNETEPWFQRQFRDKNGLTLAVTKDHGEIDAITGATITSRAVSNSVREAAIHLQQATKELQERIASADSSAAPMDSTAMIARGGEE